MMTEETRLQVTQDWETFALNNKDIADAFVESRITVGKDPDNEGQEIDLFVVNLRKGADPALFKKVNDEFKTVIPFTVKPMHFGGILPVGGPPQKKHD